MPHPIMARDKRSDYDGAAKLWGDWDERGLFELAAPTKPTPGRDVGCSVALLSEDVQEDIEYYWQKGQLKPDTVDRDIWWPPEEAEFNYPPMIEGWKDRYEPFRHPQGSKKQCHKCRKTFTVIGTDEAYCPDCHAAMHK